MHDQLRHSVQARSFLDDNIYGADMDLVTRKSVWSVLLQGSHRLEKYLNIECVLEKYLKIKYALKSTGKSLKGLEKSLNFTILCRT